MKGYSIDEWNAYYNSSLTQLQQKQNKVSGILDCFCKGEFKTQNIKIRNKIYQEGNSQVEVCREWLFDFATV
jgi:hypothetical protein